MSQLYRVGDFIDAELPNKLFLIEPFMPIGGHCLLYGKRAGGKTQLALTIAHHVLRGELLFGSFPCTQGPVVYIQADMPPVVQQDRLRRAAATIRHNDFYIVPLERSYDIRSICAHPPMWAEQILTIAPKLVIVDTLRRSHTMEENSSDTPVEVYNAWRSLLGTSTTVLYLHHDRKTFTKPGDAGEDRTEEFRGSGAWLDEADLGLHMLKYGRGDKFKLEWTKLRTCEDAAVPEFLTLAMQQDTLLLDIYNPVEAWLSGAMKQKLPKAQIVEHITNERHWGKNALSRATAYRRLERYE